MGGTKSQNLNRIAKRIWLFAEQNHFSITGLWIPSKENQIADQLSRRGESAGDWLLNGEVFSRIIRKMGIPTVDAFASLAMHQMTPYWSWEPDPKAERTNALVQNWNGHYPYLFPPFCLIHKVLRKVRVQRVEKAILIAPLWPGQSWFPSLLNMSVSVPFLLPQVPDLLTNHMGEPHPMLTFRKLKLGAFLISSNDSWARAFRHKLQISSQTADGLALQNLTNHVGTGGYLGVIEGMLIPLRHL